MVLLGVFDKVAGDFTVGDGGGASTEYWPSSSCDRLGHRQRNRNMWPALISTFTSQKEHFNSDLQRVTFSSFLIVFFPPPLWSYCVSTIKHWLFDPYLEGLLNTDTFKAPHAPFFFFTHLLIPKIKGREAPRSLSAPSHPPIHPAQIYSHHSWLWHWTLFQGFSSHLSYSLLFPPLFFSIFNSAPEWGLCEARHACQREI